MKTIFKRFRVRNALSFEYADMPLEDQGFVLIKGENLDEGGSNGSGKTTLFELLSLNIYDKLTKTDRRVTKSNLLNVHHPKGFITRLDFSSDGVPFCSENFRSHPKKGNGMKIYKESVDVTPDDPREARKSLIKLVGLNWSEYLGRVYLSQRYTHMMIDGTPAQKREYLSMSFGLDTLDMMTKEVTKRLNAIPLPDESQLQSMLESVNSDLDSLGDPSEIDARVLDLSDEQKKLQDTLVTLHVDLEKNESAYQVNEQREEWERRLKAHSLSLKSSSLKKKLEESRELLSSEQKNLSSLLRKEKLESQLSSLTEDIDLSLSSIGDIEASLEKVEFKLERLDTLLPSVERRESLYSKLEKIEEDDLSVDSLKSRVAKWGNKLSEAKGSVSALRAELSKLESLGDVCYACLRPIDSSQKNEMIEERRESLSMLAQLQKKASTALTVYEDRLESAKKRTSILSELDGLPSHDVDKLKASLDTLKKKRSDLRSSLSLLSKYRSVVDQLEELASVGGTVDHSRSRIEELNSLIPLLEDSYAWSLKNGDVSFDPDALERARLAVSSTNEALSSLSEELISLREISVRISSLKKQKEDLTRTLNRSSEEKQRSRVLRYLNLTLDDMKKAALRDSAQLLSTVLPVYLNQLFPDGSIQLEVTDDADGFDLMFHKGGHSIPLTLVSGGQSKRIGLAIIFAFAKMGRNTTNLLICDEPFRDLDKKGREACFEVLRDFDMGTVLITSHDQDMSSLRRYDQVWTVKMKNHVSRLYTE